MAALRPPHLAAICPWEGATDYYREFTHHGGIPADFLRQWYPPQVEAMQHGVGDRSPRSAVTGVPVAGPETLDEAELVRNRTDVVAEMLSRPTLDEHYWERTADLPAITVPVLSATNWGHHLRLTVLGRDFTFDGPGPWPHSYGEDMRGNGIFVHTIDRAPAFRRHDDDPQRLGAPAGSGTRDALIASVGWILELVDTSSWWSAARD